MNHDPGLWFRLPFSWCKNDSGIHFNLPRTHCLILMGLWDGWDSRRKHIDPIPLNGYSWNLFCIPPRINDIPECYRIINRIIEFQLVYSEETGLKWSYGEEGEEVVLVVEFKWNHWIIVVLAEELHESNCSTSKGTNWLAHFANLRTTQYNKGPSSLLHFLLGLIITWTKPVCNLSLCALLNFIQCFLLLSSATSSKRWVNFFFVSCVGRIGYIIFAILFVTCNMRAIINCLMYMQIQWMSPVGNSLGTSHQLNPDILVGQFIPKAEPEP